MALLRPLLAAAASVAIAAATATGQRAPGLACKHGALAAGGDIKRENMTVASASAWCESQPACAGFTANTNGTAGICGGGGGSEQLFDMRFKDSEQGNGDPLWTTWTRPRLLLLQLGAHLLALRPSKRKLRQGDVPGPRLLWRVQRDGAAAQRQCWSAAGADRRQLISVSLQRFKCGVERPR